MKEECIVQHNTFANAAPPLVASTGGDGGGAVAGGFEEVSGEDGEE